MRLRRPRHWFPSRVALIKLVGLFFSIVLLAFIRHGIGFYSYSNRDTIENFETDWYQHFVDNQNAMVKGYRKPMFVVVAMHPKAGNCNRITNLLSSFLLAILTNRGLAFDWDMTEEVMYDGIESISNAQWEDLFLALPFQWRWSEIKKMRNLPDASYLIDYPLNIPMCEDYLEFFKEHAVIKTQRYDWWGPLLYSNEIYSKRLKAIGFPIFKTLASKLLIPSAEVQKQMHDHSGVLACDVGVQIRRSWNRVTATDEAFLKTATYVGDETTSKWLSYDKISSTASFHNAGFHLITDGVPCRNGSACNIRGISDLFQLSRCKQIITTWSSTFGRCAAGISGTVPYVVMPDGTFFKDATSEPIDVGGAAEVSPFVDGVKCPANRGFFSISIPWTSYDTFMVEWQAPAKGIRQYKVIISSGSFNRTDSVMANATITCQRWAVGHLTPGQEYNVTIEAISVRRKRFESFTKIVRTTIHLESHRYKSIRRISQPLVKKPNSAKANACIVILLLNFDSSMEAPLKECLARLDDFYNRNFQYDVVIVTGKNMTLAKRLLIVSWTSSLVYFSDAQHFLAYNKDYIINTIGAPEIWRLRPQKKNEVITHPGFNLDYRNMGRFAAGPLFLLKELQKYDFFWKIDVDSFLLAEVKEDPFVIMKQHGIKLGYVDQHADNPTVVDNLESAFREYLAINRTVMKDPRRVFPLPDAAYNAWNFYGCSIWGDLNFFRSNEYQSLFSFLDTFHGWYKYRWDEQKVYAFAISTYFERAKSFDFSTIVHLEHQGYLGTPKDDFQPCPEIPK